MQVLVRLVRTPPYSNMCKRRFESPLCGGMCNKKTEGSSLPLVKNVAHSAFHAVTPVREGDTKSAG